jgi:hypothetical protein
LAGLTLLRAQSAHAYCQLTTSMAVAGFACSTSGEPLLWARQCISYSVVPRTHAATPSLEEIRNTVDHSFATWGEVQCNGHRIGLALGQTDDLSMCNRPEYNETKSNSNSVIFVEDWAARDLPKEAFGLTLVWHDPKTGQIFDADMQLNETLGTLDICTDNTCLPGHVDMQNIITHEAGHFLGLGHSDLTNACMYGRAEVGETSKRYLARDDEDGICKMYGSLAATACAQSDYLPEGGFAAQCQDEGSDGGDGTTTSSSSNGGWCSVNGAADGGGAAVIALAALVLTARRRRLGR